MPSCVALEPFARCAIGDFPTGGVITARRTPHHQALAFDVQDGIVPPYATQKPTKTRYRPGYDGLAGALSTHVVCCELLGVIGHHCAETPSPPVWDAWNT
jgi:hypothetical protein